MQTPDAIKAYACLSAEQLRWEKARGVVTRELETHLLDQRDALEAKGLSAAEAEAESIRLTGDPVAIGTELDRVHRPKMTWSILVLTALLAALGVAIKAFLTYDANFPLQLSLCVTAAVLGGCCLLAAYFIDFTIIGKRPLLVYFAALALTGYLQLSQPTLLGSGSYAAYAALLLPLGCAALIYRLRGRGRTGVLLAALGAGLCCLCACLVSASALCVTFVCTAALCLYAARRDWFGWGRARSLLLVSAVLLACGAGFILSLPPDAVVSRRFLSALFPSSHAAAVYGEETLVIREFLAGARFFGRGEPGGLSALCDSMGMDTNYLLTFVIYRLGWAAFAAVMALYAAFFGLGLRSCLRQRSMLGRLTSLAVLLTLVAQTALYAVANLGFPFIMSLTLPLLSYGNTATVVNMALIGVMLSAFRTGSIVRDGPFGRRAEA